MTRQERIDNGWRLYIETSPEPVEVANALLRLGLIGESFHTKIVFDLILKEQGVLV